MTQAIQDGTKLVVLPAPLVDRLRLVAMRRGFSLADYAAESLSQALRVEEMGATLREAVDLYRLVEVQRGAGALSVSRSSMSQLLEKLYGENGDELHDIWYEAGHWYGAYLGTKMGAEDAVGFLERGLLVAWNLDEVEVERGEWEVGIRLVGFHMSLMFTELLLTYMRGLMDALDYSETDRDYLRGLGVLGYRKNIRLRP